MASRQNVAALLAVQPSNPRHVAAHGSHGSRETRQPVLAKPASAGARNEVVGSIPTGGSPQSPRSDSLIGPPLGGPMSESAPVLSVAQASTRGTSSDLCSGCAGRRDVLVVTEQVAWVVAAFGLGQPVV